MTTTSQNVRLARQVKFTDHFEVPGLADGNGCNGDTNDLAFCHLCMMGAKSCKLSSSSESAFIFSGFSNWKDVSNQMF